MLFWGRYKYSNEPNQVLIDSAHLLFDNKIITDFFYLFISETIPYSKV